MDYAVALIVYIASILGVFTAMYGMVVFRDDRKMVYFMTLTCFVFCATTYLGGMMIQTVSERN